MASDKQDLYALIATLEPSIERAFLDAIESAVTAIPFAQVVAAFSVGDIERGIELMELTPAAWASLNSTIGMGYQTAGTKAAAKIPTALTVQFDISDVEIEAFIKQNVGGRIKEISDKTRQLIRDELNASFARGDNPRTTVSKIVGKVNRATGRREGGIIGLTRKQVGWLDNARRELDELDSAYFQRKARDKRHDKTVAKAIRENKPLPQKTINAIVDKYSNKLLRERAKTIAQTETMTAINASKILAFEKAARQNKIKLEWVDKIWKASGDSRVRHTHRGMNGQVRGFRERFNSSSGATLDYPSDPRAAAVERINCRCWLQLRVNQKRRYGVE